MIINNKKNEIIFRKMINNKNANQKWYVLFGMFFCYLFAAMGMIYLSLSISYIVEEWNILLSMAGLLGSAMLLGIGFSSIIVGWYSDNYGRKKH